MSESEMIHSRIPRFFNLGIKDRRKTIFDQLGLEDTADATSVCESGGISPNMADKIVENVLGIYSLPFGIALNAEVNGQDRLIPMVVEEPSVIAAVSNACKMIRAGGGFTTKMTESLMIAQIELRKVEDVEHKKELLLQQRNALLEAASAQLTGLVGRGGGPRDIEVRIIGPDHMVLHLLVDCCDAMGANLVNGAAEAIGPRCAAIVSGQLGLRILSNLTDRRMVNVSVSVPGQSLLSRNSTLTPHEVLDAVEAASVFAERDPYRAATHNKGIMNGIDSVVIATGNDYRAVEAGAHAFAAKSGTYKPLCIWRREGNDLKGQMTLPLALGIVGGTLRVHPGARLALSITQAKSADDLAQLAACAGVASNLAALVALSTEGIQRGHMSLHARSVAIFAGAKDDEVSRVAEIIAKARDVTLAAATAALEQVRNSTQR